MNVIVIILALLAILGGVYGAIKGDVQIVGLAVALCGAAVLLPLVF